MDFEVEGVRHSGESKKTWSEVIRNIDRPDIYARKMLWMVGNGKS